MQTNAGGASLYRGSVGIIHQKVLKCGVSEMVFSAFSILLTFPFHIIISSYEPYIKTVNLILKMSLS